MSTEALSSHDSALQHSSSNDKVALERVPSPSITCRQQRLREASPFLPRQRAFGCAIGGGVGGGNGGGSAVWKRMRWWSWSRHAMALCAWLLLLLLCTHHVNAQFTTNPLPLNSANALMVNGITTTDQSGGSVSWVGDMNGDGVNDYAIGARMGDPIGVSDAGEVYLLFGSGATPPPGPGNFELSTLDGTNGVTLNGVTANKLLGFSVAGVRDVNADGVNDVLIGTRFDDVAFLVFGVNGTWLASQNLTQNAFNGVTIKGQTGDFTGFAVSGAGDVNNDGVPDVAVGVPEAGTSGGSDAGRMDVLYGRSGSWPAVVDLASYVNASTGFSVLGGVANGQCGHSVSGIGDVNGDGVEDVAVGCIGASPYGETGAGLVAVVFGSASGALPVVMPSQLNGTNGFVVNGQHEGDEIGRVVAGVGDVNADGLDDFAVASRTATSNALPESGVVHVLFGRNDSVSVWPAEVNVSSLDGTNGFTLAGSDEGGHVGQSVNTAGDVNGDGIDDLLVGAMDVDIGGRAYVVYGRVVWPASQSTSDLNVNQSATFEGQTSGDRCGFSVSALGDVNGDGRGDLAIGCNGANPGSRPTAGQTAIVLGPVITAVPTTAAPTTSPTAAPTTSPTTAPTTHPTTITPTSSPTITPTLTTAPTPSTAPTTGSATPPPTSSPTSLSCVRADAFVPPGASCMNGILVTRLNTTTPRDQTVTVSTSIMLIEGATFEQPVGSTIVFVVEPTTAAKRKEAGQSTSIAVADGGCAIIAGDAQVRFESDPSGADGNTGSLALVTASCVQGEFGSVDATTSFERDECIAIGEGVQTASGNSLSVSFAVSNECSKNSTGLSDGAVAGIALAGFLLVTILVVVAVILGRSARNDVKMSQMRTLGR